MLTASCATKPFLVLAVGFGTESGTDCCWCISPVRTTGRCIFRAQRHGPGGSHTCEVDFGEPCTQEQGHGGHVHRDMARLIRCIRAAAHVVVSSPRQNHHFCFPSSCFPSSCFPSFCLPSSPSPRPRPPLLVLSPLSPPPLFRPPHSPSPPHTHTAEEPDVFQCSGSERKAA